MPDPQVTPAQESLVTPTQIAALAGVGRAAVSNWRRRYLDFPQAVGGSVNSPLFARGQVESWLVANGRLGLNAAAVNRLGEVSSDDLAETIEYLADRDRPLGPAKKDAINRLLESSSAADVAGYLVEQHALRASVGESGPMPKIAEIIASLVPGHRTGASPTVLDPRCGYGTLLPGLAQVWGEDCVYVAHDADRVNLRITAGLLRLRGCEAVTVEYDGLSGPPPSGPQHADVVVCAIPAGKAAASETTMSAVDRRWTFGVPPPAFPEYAWLQHCLSLIAADGLCALLMPASAATNTAGRRIRTALVRLGSLSTVLTVPAWAVPGAGRAGQIWLLCRPDFSVMGTDELAGPVRMIDASDYDERRLDAAIADRWRDAASDPRVSRDVPRADLLDGDTELLPARWLSEAAPDVVGPFQAARAELLEVLASLNAVVPELGTATSASRTDASDTVTVGELATSGALEILPGSSKAVIGDILVNPIELDRSLIITDAGHATSNLAKIRCDEAQVNPYFLLGHLRSAANRRLTETLGSRRDVRKARIPRIGIDEQRRLAADIKALVHFAELSGRSRTLSNTFVTLAFEGLSTGALSSRTDPIIDQEES